MAKEKIVLCDTNILIEALRQNSIIIEQLNLIGIDNIAISIITYAELLYGARDKAETNKIKKYIQFIRLIPANSEISELFVELINKYSLSHRIGIPDTFIAATALHYNLSLYTLNSKDFKFISNLNLYVKK
jgi:tRNA(fMet)-specific endonuclease VapC